MAKAYNVFFPNEGPVRPLNTWLVAALSILDGTAELRQLEWWALAGMSMNYVKCFDLIMASNLGPGVGARHKPWDGRGRDGNVWATLSRPQGGGQLRLLGLDDQVKLARLPTIVDPNEWWQHDPEVSVESLPQKVCAATQRNHWRWRRLTGMT